MAFLVAPEAWEKELPPEFLLHIQRHSFYFPGCFCALLENFSLERLFLLYFVLFLCMCENAGRCGRGHRNSGVLFSPSIMCSGSKPDLFMGAKLISACL